VTKCDLRCFVALVFSALIAKSVHSLSALIAKLVHSLSALIPECTEKVTCKIGAYAFASLYYL